MADDSFPIDEAQLVALFMESVAYGVYLVTLGQCLRILLWGSASRDGGLSLKRNINWPMLIVALLLATFATLDVAFGLRHVLDAFIYYKGPGGAKAEFANISYWIQVMKVRRKCPSVSNDTDTIMQIDRRLRYSDDNRRCYAGE